MFTIGEVLEIIKALHNDNPIIRSRVLIIGEKMPEEINWLDENGICDFPAEIKNKPNGIFIASGFIDVLELVVGLVWNKPGPGFGIYDWDVSEPIPANVLERIMGVQMDVETINWIQENNAGRGILLGEAGGDIQDNGLTPDEWLAKYGTNGVAMMAKQRLFYVAKGGGIHPSYKPNRTFGVHAVKPEGVGSVTTDLGTGKKPYVIP